MKKLFEKFMSLKTGAKISLVLAVLLLVTGSAYLGSTLASVLLGKYAGQPGDKSGVTAQVSSQGSEGQSGAPAASEAVVSTQPITGTEPDDKKSGDTGNNNSNTGNTSSGNTGSGNSNTGSGNGSTGSGNSGSGNGNTSSAPVKYKVQFAVNGGGSLDALQVAPRTKISTLPTPSRDEHLFLGWYYDAGLTDMALDTDGVDDDMTLYASWVKQEPLESLERVNFASAEDVGTDFSLRITTSEAMTARQVADAIAASNLNDPDSKNIIKVTGDGTSFTVRGVNNSGIGGAEVSGFEKGASYSLKLKDERLSFTGQPETAREFNFTTYQEEVMNLKLRSDLAYIPAGSLSSITNNGKYVDSLDIALYRVGRDGSMSAVDLTEGTFVYKEKELAVGDTAVIYEGLIPTERTLDTPDNLLGDVAYVEITGKDGQLYSYKNAEAEAVLFEPDMLPMPVGADLDASPATVTVEERYLDYSGDFYAQMELDSQTKVEPGDYLVFYTGDLTVTSGENAAERTGFALITKVTDNGDGTVTIACEETSWEAVESSVDLYTEDTLTAEEMLAGVNTDALEAQIEQQAYDSGFAEEAAQYLASLALATDNFTRLSENMNLEDYKVVLTEGEAVSPETLQLMASGIRTSVSGTRVKASIGTRPTHLSGISGTNASRQGLALYLDVETTLSIDSNSGGTLNIALSAEFVEELGYDFSASAKAEWDLAFIIPYISDVRLSACVDAINYTGVEIDAVMTSGGSFSDATNIAEEIRNLIEQNSAGSAITDERIINRYCEMVNTNTEWVKLLEINIYSIEKHLPPALPVLALEMNVNFVVKADASLAVGFDFKYLEGKRYTFTLGVKDRKVTSDSLVLQEKTYEMGFYALGRLSLKAGIQLEFKIGMFSTDLANVGFEAEAGPYAKMWGYFFYELKYSASRGRTKDYAGAMLVEVGAYFDLSVGAEAIGGRYAATANVVDEEWTLLQVGKRKNVFDFTMPQSWMPKIKLKQYIRTAQISEDVFCMDTLDLKKGEVESKIYDDRYDFVITMTNKKFTYDPYTNKIEVHPGQKDKVLDGEMIITWRNQSMTFSSTPMQRRVSLHWDDLRSGYMIVPYTNGGSYLPVIIEAYEGKVTALEDPEWSGYTFGGWYSNQALTKPYTFPKTMPATDTNIYAKWNPATNIPYTVEHYKENYASGEYELAEIEKFKGTTDTYVTPGVKRYEGYNIPQTKELRVLADGSAVLNYYYTVQRHTVTFKAGIVDQDDIVYDLKYGMEFAAPQMAAKGYRFTGWSPAAPETVMGTRDLTYTAQWEKEPDTEYRVEYYVQQKDGRYTLQYLQKYKAFTDTLIYAADLRNALVDSGKTADETYVDGDGIVYENMTVKGMEMTDGIAKVSGDGKTVIKINYRRALSDLTFDPGYENAVPVTKAIYYGQTVDRPGDPVRTGYRFRFWTLDGETEAEIEPVMGPRPVTYTALWDAHNYTVRFHKGGDMATGEMADQPFIYDEEQPLSANAFVREHYSFAGWSAQEGGSAAHPDKAVVRNLTAVSDGVVDLHALWKPTEYSITYHNMELAAGANPDKYTVETETFTLKAPARTGYDFAGWYADRNYETEVTEIAKGSSGNRDLYAKWTARRDIPYRAEHYKQQLDGNYTLADVDTLTGTADAIVMPAVKIYTGFTAPEVQEITVAADGTTVVRYDYLRNTYTLTFVAGEGWFAGEEEPVTEEEPAAEEEQVPDEEKTAEEPTNEDVLTAREVVPDGEVILGKETVPADEGTEPEGTGTNVITITALYGEAITLPTPIREGYGFAGWYNGDEKFESATMPAGDLTLTAQWKEGEYAYTVNHYKQNVDGGDYTLAETQRLTGLMDHEITPEAKTYEGFTAPAELETMVISNNEAENVVNYYYTRNQYTLSWDFGGGSANGQNSMTEKLYYGADITAPVPEKTGYRYAWDTAPAAVMPAEELSYTAVWTANSYPVSFHVNGGAVVSGTADTRYVAFDAPYGELAVMEKTGYTFSGWYTEAEGGTEVTAQTLLNTAEPHTLYAQFEMVTYTIRYTDSLAGEHENPVEYNVVSGGLTIVDAVKEGYTFLGWYENGEKVTLIPAGTVGDRQLEAQWKEHAYTVTFHSNNGFANTTQQNFTYTEEKTLDAKPEIFTKPGYKFLGWAETVNGEKVYDDAQTVKSLTASDGGNRNLYAVWAEDTYTVSYVFVNPAAPEGAFNRYLMDVNNPAENFREFTISNNYFALQEPARPGYTFCGWFADEALTKPVDVEVTFSDYRNWTFYGKFIPNRYEVTYETHVGINVTRETWTYDESGNLPLMSSLVPEGKMGYSFLGWALNANAGPGDVVYADGANVSNITTGYAVTLHAVWVSDAHSIQWNLGNYTTDSAEDESKFPKEYSYAMGDDFVLPTPTPMDGFHFGGWYENPEYSGAAVEKILLTDTKDYVLYAKWMHAGVFSIEMTEETKTGGATEKASFDATYTVTRTVPEGAVPADDVQTVYLRTVNGTAYGVTPSVASQSKQDKYHFIHLEAKPDSNDKSNAVLEFYPDGEQSQTVVVTEKDTDNSNYLPSCYRISGTEKRYYYVQIHKVESRTGGMDGVIDGEKGKVKREIKDFHITSYTDLYERESVIWYWTEDQKDEIPLTNKTINGEKFEVGQWAYTGGLRHRATYANVQNCTYNCSLEFSVWLTGEVYQEMYIALYANRSRVQREHYAFSTTTPPVELSSDTEAYYQYSRYSGSDKYQLNSAYVHLKINDKKAPAQQYVAPLGLTPYRAGEDVMLTVIFDEVINMVDGTPTLDLSSGELSTYLRNAEYVDNGTGTNTLVFKAKAVRDLTADDVANINRILCFKENGSGYFYNKIGKMTAVIRDLCKNTARITK